MPILDFGGAPTPKPRKNLRLVLGIGTIVAGIGIGSTFAGNISLNGGGNAEFGQGVQTTAACDNNVSVTPTSEFKNSENQGETRYTLKEIKVSGINLAPEGWDYETGTWNEHFNPGDLETRSWDQGYEENSGKYFDGTNWINTCEGKVLMLSAYTDDHAEATVDGNINSPLWLNGSSGEIPSTANGVNSAVGIRIYVLPPQTLSDGLIWVTDVLTTGDGNSDRSTFNSLDADWNWGTDDDPTDSFLTMYLDVDSNLPPIDSRWVNKITIESKDANPSGWAVENDWFGQLT